MKLYVLSCYLLLIGGVVGVFALITIVDLDVFVVRQKVLACLDLEQERAECLSRVLCEYDLGYLCAESIVANVSALKGPEEGIAVLREISESSAFSVSGDFHQLAHTVGRTTSKYYGSAGEVFNRCPIDFDYGCVHGFFEGLLVESSVSFVNVINQVCGSFDENSLDREQCYHGSGHGVMMQEGYHLKNALTACREISIADDQEGCISGVFMENALGFVAGRVPPENAVFLPHENWLAPCDSIEHSYKHVCYHYHHRRYLPYLYSAHLDDLVGVCFSAKGEDVELCFAALSESFITIGGDVISRGTLPRFSGDRVSRAALLCDLFPDSYVSLCHSYAIGRILGINDTESGFRSAARYCAVATKGLPVVCKRFR